MQYMHKKYERAYIFHVSIKKVTYPILKADPSLSSMKLGH